MTSVYGNVYGQVYGNAYGPPPAQAPTPASVAVSPATATVLAGGTQQFTAAVKDSAGSPIAGLTAAWMDVDAGAITQTGLYTADPHVTSGQFNVTATYGQLSGSATVTLAAPAEVATTVTDADAPHILSGYSVGGVAGTATVPPAANVSSGLAYGVGGNGSTGALAVTAGGGLTGEQAAQLAAAAAAVSQLGGGQLAYTGPVAVDGSARIVQADDAMLQWTVAGYAGPSLAGSVTTFGLMDRCDYDCNPAGVTLLAVPGTAATVAAPDGSTLATYTAQLTAAQTAALPSAPADRPLNLVGQVVVTTAGGLRRTAVLAAVTVVRRVV